MFQLSVPPLELVARSIIIYAIFLALLRIFGKRELGQFTLFDLALVLLAANALQPAITGPDQSLAGGVIIMATLFTLNRSLAFARARVPWVRGLLEFKPTVIGRDGTWLLEIAEREGLDESDLDAALREHGLDDVSEMKLATLEEDGSISIVPQDDVPGIHSARRRRRYRRPR